MIKQVFKPTIIKGKSGDQVHEKLTKYDLSDKDINEKFIQEAIHKSPELLPIEEINDSFLPIISLGREIVIEGNKIDNLYISPNGRLTIVETKLWRNHEATREVVAQILDYATYLKEWSYEILEEQCKNVKNTVIENSLYDYVKSNSSNISLSENEFIDSVERVLKRGEFLLLIVGDGIKENVSNLISTIYNHPDLLFTFGLVELKIYNYNSTKLVIPNIVSIIKPDLRAVIEVNTIGEGKTEISFKELNINDEDKSRRKLSSAEFYDKLEYYRDSNHVMFVQGLLSKFKDPTQNKFIDWLQSGPILKYKKRINGKDKDFNFGQFRYNGEFTSTDRLGDRFKELNMDYQKVHDYFNKLMKIIPNSDYRSLNDSERSWYLFENSESSKSPDFIHMTTKENDLINAINILINEINLISNSIYK